MFSGGCTWQAVCRDLDSELFNECVGGVVPICHVLGGDGTKIALPGNMFHQPPTPL